MPMVEVSVNGRRHAVQCGEGEESRVRRLASYIDRKIGEIAKDKMQLGESRLLVMASLLIADELSDAFDEIKRLRVALDETSSDSEQQAAAAIEQVAQQLNAIAAHLESS